MTKEKERQYFTYDESLQKLALLIDNFERDIDRIKKEDKEAHVEDNYIKPFFALLNWNVANTGLSADRREFIVQARVVQDDKSATAPDYLFCVRDKDNPARMKKTLFMEAKQPKYKLTEHAGYIRQAYRYAWSTQSLATPEHERVPLALLTDFEEFRLFDCRASWPLEQKSNIAAHFNKYIVSPFDLQYTQYLEHFQEIWNAFEYTNVLNGSLDSFRVSEADLRKRRAAPDIRFLDHLKSWRRDFARDMYANDTSLDGRTLTSATQLMVNRIVFIKMLADRGLEDDYLEKLRTVLTTSGKPYVTWDDFTPVFSRLDTLFNGSIFKRCMESDVGKINTDTITAILESLQPERSVYDLSAMPVEVIGAVYESFLGDIICLENGTAELVQKLEVRKAGGVFYTPAYIVKNIIENTVGKKLTECATPDDVARLKIVDPACGSGAFLLGAFDCLLKWHVDWYRNKVVNLLSKKKSLEDIQKTLTNEIRLYSTDNSPDGFILHLTAKVKRDILLNCIHGVDIDQQAVETAQFSLSMKAVEDTTREELHADATLFKQAILPSLDKNIRHGNSLIAPEFWEEQLDLLQDTEAVIAVNAFDWDEEFKNIFLDGGGFDCVIGNPPYLRIQGLTENYNNQLEYYLRVYVSAVKRFDLYLLFIEQGYSLLNNTGLLGYICPNKFINSDFGSGLREFLIKHKAINQFISFGNNLVFSEASTYTGILSLSKPENPDFSYYEFPNIGNASIQEHLEGIGSGDFTEYSADKFSSDPWVLSHSGADTVLAKIGHLDKLQDCFSNIFQGVVTGIDSLYFLKACSQEMSEDGIIEVFSEREGQVIKIERAILKPVLKGDDAARYQEPANKYYTIYPYVVEDGKTKIIQETVLAERFPLAYKYLSVYKDELRALRIKYKTNSTYWYSCHRGREISLFEQKRIITPEISLGCNMTISPASLYHNTKVYSLLPKPEREENLYYWLGILNSKLMWFFIKTTGYVLRGGYYTFKTEYMKPFPIRTIDFKKYADKKHHDDMVKLVEAMLTLKKQFTAATTTAQQSVFKRIIDSTDAKIDALVYVLYDLTPEEIKIVEGTA